MYFIKFVPLQPATMDKLLPDWVNSVLTAVRTYRWLNAKDVNFHWFWNVIVQHVSGISDGISIEIWVSIIWCFFFANNFLFAIEQKSNKKRFKISITYTQWTSLWWYSFFSNHKCRVNNIECWKATILSPKRVLHFELIVFASIHNCFAYKNDLATGLRFWIAKTSTSVRPTVLRCHHCYGILFNSVVKFKNHY